MEFYPNQLFHIYNQGNNRQTLFFTEENYEYFIWKMRAYLPPFGDLVAYCLMPNHFHWLFFVRKTVVERKALWIHVDQIEWLRRKKKYGEKAIPVEQKRIANPNAQVSLNEAIGTLQKVYTRAINHEKEWTGSLFRKKCKAKDGWIDEFVTLRKTGGKLDYRFVSGTDYAFHCHNYIHNNPVEAGLAKESTDWKFSSARDYTGLRKGSLCNVELGRKILGPIRR